MNANQNGPSTTPDPKKAVSSADGEVGYCRPPRAHQFKPGQSGYPKGRRKGSKNQTTILKELLQRKLTIREGGKSRKVTVLEAIYIRVLEDSLKGNVKSAAFLLNRHAAMVSGEAAHTDLGEDDREVFDAFVKDLQARSREQGV